MNMVPRKWPRHWLKVGACAAALVMATHAGAAETVKIGFIDLLSGPFALTGQSSLNQLREVVAQVNAKAGPNEPKFEVMDFDNKGTPQEMYVWPYLAHVPLADLSPRQSVDLYRLMTAQDVRDMRTLGSWVFLRLGIGPDGTVHFFLS